MGNELMVLEPAPARVLTAGGTKFEIKIGEGHSIQRIVESCLPEHMWENVVAYNHGHIIKDLSFVPIAGDSILITVVPAGGGKKGKGIIGAILTIVVAVVAWYVAPVFVGGSLGGMAALTGTNALIAQGIAAGLTMLGTMAVSALIAPPKSSTNPANAGIGSPASYSLTGQSNAPRPYQACYVVYGQHKVYPPIATNPDIDNWATSSSMSMLYDFGLGYVNIYDVRIGDVPWEEYSPAVGFYPNSYGESLVYTASRIGYDQYALEMKQNDPIVVRTKKNSICANLDYVFPKGLFQATPNGAIPFTIVLRSQWRKVGTQAWNEVPLDWFHGAQREYDVPPPGTVTFRLREPSSTGGFPNYIANEAYDPAQSPSRMKSYAAQWRSKNFTVNPSQVYANFEQFSDNPNLVFRFPDGMINDADYWNRYPEWNVYPWNSGFAGNAQAHFKTIGSRIGLIPGVRVTIDGYGDYDYLTTPYQLHQADMQQFPNWWDGGQYVGGWSWIEASGGLSSGTALSDVPWEWSYDVFGFRTNAYLNRYPDVRAWTQASPYNTAQSHFERYGAFEGRNPYDADWAVNVRMTAAFVGPYWMRIFYVFPEPGEYELQITRFDKVEDGTDMSWAQITGGQIQGRYNEATVALLRSYEAGNSVTPRLRHTFMEMRVVATDKLQGVVQNLSAIAVSVLPVTNDGSNFWWAQTRNPAWICLDILTSEKNPRPLSRAQIDWPSWLQLAQICDTPRYWVANGYPYSGPRYTCDIVITDFGTVNDLVNSILSGCRATLTLTMSGKWGVIIDQVNDVSRQMITPENSWGFSGARMFSDTPHALRVNFINMDKGYNQDEVIVYWDGYGPQNATIFETLDTYGITDYPHAWAYGRFMMAQGIQRSEIFTVNMDVENLVVQRGNRVEVAFDVPNIGGYPTRVVETLGNNQIRVNTTFGIMPTGYAVRLENSTVKTGQVLSADQETGIYTLSDAQWILPEDLIVFGTFDRVVQPYIVQRITPGSDLTAELTLCKYVPAIYDADIGALPPWDPGFGDDLINSTNLVVINVTVIQEMVYREREPFVYVNLDWMTTGWGLSHHRITLIFVNGGAKEEVLTSTLVPMTFRMEFDSVRQLKYFNVPLQFQITPISDLGLEGVSGYINIVLLTDTSPPQIPPNFAANVQKETINLFWHHPPDPDIDHYILRYSPDVQSSNWEASNLLATISYPTTTFSIGARTGTYMIKAVDTSGNKSGIAFQRTTIQELPDINLIFTINDVEEDPRWPGKKNQVVVDGNDLVLDGDWGAVVPEGQYYMSTIVDLGQVYEARVSSKFRAYGITATDLMYTWDPLSEVEALATASSDMWDVWLEVRTSNRQSMIADWVTMSSIDPIADANDADWSPWRRVRVGDFTAQLFQFRFQLRSYNANVKPSINSGLIEIDMPDRIDSQEDVLVPAGTIDIDFEPAFRNVPAIAITIDGNTEALIPEVTNKTNSGFTLGLRQMPTSLGAPRAYIAGKIDWMAKGYGRQRTTSI